MSANTIRIPATVERRRCRRCDQQGNHCRLPSTVSRGTPDRTVSQDTPDGNAQFICVECRDEGLECSFSNGYTVGGIALPLTRYSKLPTFLHS